MSLGTYRVGTDFNPAGNFDVNEIKRRAADLIDCIQDTMKRIDPEYKFPEAQRCAAIACTEIESAAMWAVKAVTKRKQETP